MKEELLKNEQYYDKYYVVAPGSDYGKVLFSDIGKLNNAEVLDNPVSLNNKLLRILHHAHFSFAINSKVQLPFQNIWRFAYSINKVGFDTRKKYCVIISDVAAGRMDIAFLRKLSAMENVDIVLVLVNVMKKKTNIMQRRLGLFDQIYTFDKADAEQYGFFYHPDFYSKLDLCEDQVKTDAFFVGSAGRRLPRIHGIYQKLINSGCSVDFWIKGVRKKEQLGGAIHYNKTLKYVDVLKHSLQSNCIVEVVENGQQGGTMRQHEAVVYNKKLLTNNKSIKDSPCYDERYIHIIESEDDIDVSFVTEQISVDYCYNDEFSPIYLIDHINEVKSKSSQEV